MFNPKQALERIRRNKMAQEDNSRNSEDHGEHLFPQNQSKSQKNNSNKLDDRVTRLQQMVAKLTQQLGNSNETVVRLKKQNSNLQTQVLKLQYQNSQLKSTQMYSQIRRNNSQSRLPQTIKQQSKQREKSFEKVSKKIDTRSPLFQSYQPPIKMQMEQYSVQVQEAIRQIKQQPIQNILKRKQYQFRAHKPEKKTNQNYNKCLKELADIEKDYKKTMTKPILVIKLDDVDFQ